MAKISPSGIETMAVVVPHRSKCCSRSKSQLCRDFRGFSFSIFESSARILPSPCFPVCHCYGQYEPKSPSFLSEQEGKQRTKRKTISLNTPPKVASFNDSVSFSERWAGPAYSNSPPPSSLPIPKFSLRQKRSVSLVLQTPKVTATLPALSKSAPSSPTKDSPLSAGNLFFNTVIATENLRRILQLDIENH